jgi:nicotinamide-nucleotide amidase
MVEGNMKQADFPSGSLILPNSVGTAPGFALRIGKALALFFPGVPVEMRRMWDEKADGLVRKLARATTHQIRLRTYGEGESSVGQMLSDIERLYPGVTVGYRASFPEVEVKVFARGDSEQDAIQRAEHATLEVKRRLGPLLIAEGQTTFVGAMAAQIRAHGQTLALAESCTGGLCSELVTSEPASDYFIGSTITYSNEAKVRLLGVPSALIEKHGAVSAEVAEAMARGVCHATGASIGAAITGVAGPSGGTEEKPVGLVYWAVCFRDQVTVKSRNFVGDRPRIQRAAAFAAMALVMQRLNK